MTNLEKLRQNGSNCPYSFGCNPPVSDKEFCEDGCSVICKEEMIEKLSKSKKGQRWLKREATT